MTRKLLVALAVIISTPLLVFVSWGWVAGYYSHYPLEVRRVGIDYSPAGGANMWSIHAGVHGGAVYFSEEQTEPGLRQDPWLMPVMIRLSGTREWYIGRVDYVGSRGQPLLITFSDTRCVPPQRGDLLAPDWHRAGFRAFRFWTLGSVGMAVVVPCWLLVMLTAPAPALWLRRLVRRRRWGIEGRCPRCGYDLRGSPDRCPECGEESCGKRG
jgi:hypothetical protein